MLFLIYFQCFDVFWSSSLTKDHSINIYKPIVLNDSMVFKCIQYNSHKCSKGLVRGHSFSCPLVKCGLALKDLKRNKALYILIYVCNRMQEHASKIIFIWFVGSICMRLWFSLLFDGYFLT